MSKNPVFKSGPRIRDVAAAAGVSPATVSRVLNGNHRVDETLRRRVSAAVAELGYRPNRLGANMRRQKTRMIGLVVSDIENPHHTKVISTVEQRLRKDGYQMLVCSTGEAAEPQAEYLRLLRDERVAGVILSPSDPDGSEIAELLDNGIPVVSLDRSVSDHRADAVVVDNFAGTYQATRMLLAAGHTAVGYVSGLLGVESGAQRLAGYRAAITEAGLQLLWRQGEFRQEAAERATDALQRDEPITAIVVANNLMTVGALTSLRKSGVRIPEDIALIAIDDPSWASLVEPPLTAFAQPIEVMATTAADLVIERIGGRSDPPQRLLFDFVLRHRRSCGTACARPSAIGNVVAPR